MIEELAVLGGDDRVAQMLGNLLIGDDDAALDGEVADRPRRRVPSTRVIVCGV